MCVLFSNYKTVEYYSVHFDRHSYLIFEIHLLRSVSTDYGRIKVSGLDTFAMDLKGIGVQT